MRTAMFIASFTLAVLILVMLSAQAQDPSALVGAWEFTEGTDADGTTSDSHGMLIFSGGHYSWIQASRSDRPSYSSQDEATDAKKVAAFNSFGANAGSYTLSGKTLKRVPAIAKNPYVYAPGNTFADTIEIAGSTLTITRENGAVARYRRLD